MKLSELQELLKWLQMEYEDIEIKAYNDEEGIDESISQNNFSWSPIKRPESEPFIRVWLNSKKIK
jgi:hypothetical protein